MTETIPPPVSDEEIWIASNIVTAVKVEYRQTGCDTADTYIHLTDWNGNKVCWKDSTFTKVAELRLGYNSCAQPKPGVKDRVTQRLAFEKAHNTELTEYKRLRAKFEGA